MNYHHDVKTIMYPHVSHLTGMMPNKEREKRLYRLIPLIMDAFEKSESEIINWLNGNGYVWERMTGV